MASLTARTGVLGKRLAAHLLRRATFKIDPTRINSFAALTAEQAVNQLFTVPAYIHPEGPLNWEDSGTAWLTTGPYANQPSADAQRERAVQIWFMNELWNDTSIRHKMALFFHAVFITSKDGDWRSFDYWRLLQFYSLGNIKTLSYKITLDNKMLRYLNNNENKKDSPNENYAREFLELFTILKGEAVGVGDYTNYTEEDIVETAKVFTGFTTDSFTNKDPNTGFATGRANFNTHNKGNKTFSHAFDHQTIKGAVDQADMFRELQDFIDMVFAKKATAVSFVRRLYLYFVSDIINEEIENDIIDPLANQLLSDGYNVENTLKSLLKSVHFYDEDDSSATDEIIGGKIKSGLNLILSAVNTFDANTIGNLNANPNNYPDYSNKIIYHVFEPLGFPEHPETVEGYPGFFKGSGFSNNWFDQANIGHRFRLGYALLEGKSLLNNNAIPFKINVMNFFNQNFSNHEYSGQLVTQLLEYLLPEMPDPTRFSYFENKLLDGLSPINWFFEWHDYQTSGDDSAVKIVLSNLLDTVLNSPEYQTY